MRFLSRRVVVRLFPIVLAACLVCPALAEPAPDGAAQDSAKVELPKRYMRFHDDGITQQFETAVATFKNKDGVTVRLVGAIHVGEKSYYDALNKSFEDDDAVLYELVSPKGRDIPQAGQHSDNLISQMQHLMKDVLGLDFQLDDIDYTKPNFVHADMDADTFAKMQEARGETFQELMLKQVIKAFTKGHDKEDEQDVDPNRLVDGLIELVTRPDMERQVKLAVAKQLDKMEDTAMGMDNPNGSVIVTERNKVAMAVLEKTVASGKHKISIFYGAAHLPDMASRLKTMGFEPTSVQWNAAWDLTVRPDQPSAAEKVLKELVHSFDE